MLQIKKYFLFYRCLLQGRFKYYHKVGKKEPSIFDSSKIRNVGVIAHIDAGKTTTTERMLYLSGATKVLGAVDDGNTVTDYMDQERERGISITSAVAPFMWEGHKINLIDTPGHVDFTSEVQCSLSAIDGAVVILDASAGVEAQTIQVWRQADHYKIPKVIFLNKMDKASANIRKCIQSLKDKFNCRPLLLQFPVITKGAFIGIVDVLSLTKYSWDVRGNSGNVFTVSDCSKRGDGDFFSLISDERIRLLEDLAEMDEVFADRYISDPGADMPTPELISLVQQLTTSCSVVPVFLGSAQKNVGVQLLMSGIVRALPPPQKTTPSLEMLVFKTIHDKRKPLFLCRVFGGAVKGGQSVFNERVGKEEVIAELCSINGEELERVKDASAGDIVVISGPHQIITGDYLTHHSTNIEARENGNTETRESRPDIIIPDPVYFSAIETDTLAELKLLDEALACLQREDPSLKVRVDGNTGQTILGGMGQLHLEVIKERIRREYKVNVELGPLQIAYMESIEGAHNLHHTLTKTIGDAKHNIAMEMSVFPMENPGRKVGSLSVRPRQDSELMKTGLRPQFKKAIEDGIAAAFSRGVLLGHPVINVCVELTELVVTRGSSLPMVSLCTSQCLAKAMPLCLPCLLQPVMTIEIEAPLSHCGVILSDLAQRGSNPPTIQNHSTDSVTITTTAALALLQDFATALRVKTSGLATFTMRLERYEKVGNIQLARIRG